MADGTIKILVGAELDRSVEATFGQVERIAERTGRQVARAMGASSRTAAIEAEKSARESEKAWNKQLAAANKIAKAQDRLWLNSQRERVRSEERAARDIERILQQETRAKEREAAKQTRDAARELDKQISQQERAREKFASRTSQRAVRFLFPNPIGAFGMAHRIGGDILRGAGVDFSVAGSVGRAVNAQALATQLSSQGYMMGEKGPNGVRVSSATLEAEARATAKAQAMDPEAMLRAQTKFVDITGNLHDARAAMPNIAALSGATGTDPEKMAEAWANVSRHIGDVPNKAEKVYGLMKLIAGQGRVGSIEIKDEAKDLGKIAAMADKFGGDRAESIAKLTTLAQLAKAEGGAASSAQASTSIVSFVNTMTTPARIKAMMKAGMTEDTIFNMVGSGKDRTRASLKDPFTIIKAALEHTGGDVIKFGNLFKSVMAQRATNALVAAYNSGKGGNFSAVDEKLAQFGKEATLTDKQVEENNAERLKTDAAAAQDFQNALDETIAGMKNELAPAMKELKEPALEAAKAFAQVVTWAAKNPFEAVGIAITGAIARAGIESAFRAGIERALTSGNLNFGNVSATIGSAALAVGALTLAWEQLQDFKNQNGGWEGVKAFVGAGDESDFGFSAVDKVLDKQAKERAAKDDAAHPKAPIAGALPSTWDVQKPMGFGFPIPGDKDFKPDTAKHPPADPAAIGHAVAGALKGSRLDVHVTNMPATGGPMVPSSGRSPSPNELPASWR